MKITRGISKDFAETFKPLLEEYSKSDETKIYFSMWKGYLHSESPAFNPDLADFLRPYDLKFMHTSGHADTETLRAVFETVKPKCGVIPIHTEAPEKFQELFHEQTIISLKDGDVFDCNLQKTN